MDDRRSTYDGSLWGPDVCRCGGHVDPHRHTAADPYGRSIFEDDEDEMASSARLILAGGPFGGQEVDLLPADHAPPAQIVWSGWVGGFTAALYEWHGETTMDGGRADALIYRPTGRHLTPDEIPPLVAEVADLWATTPHRF